MLLCDGWWIESRVLEWVGLWFLVWWLLLWEERLRIWVEVDTFWKVISCVLSVSWMYEG